MCVNFLPPLGKGLKKRENRDERLPGSVVGWGLRVCARTVGVRDNILHTLTLPPKAHAITKQSGYLTQSRWTQGKPPPPPPQQPPPHMPCSSPRIRSPRCGRGCVAAASEPCAA
jgi:hypothetical protein